ncbi:MAG: SIR2 family protein [Eubacteriales bacterium]
MNLEKVIFHNNTLDEASTKNSVDTIKYYFQQLCQLDNLILVIGSGFSKYINSPLMTDLSRTCLKPAIIAGYKKYQKFSRKLKTWSYIWGINSDEEKKILQQINTKRLISDDLDKILSKINIERKINELKIIRDTYELLDIRDKKFFNKILCIIERNIVEQIKAVIPNELESWDEQLSDKLLLYRNFFKKLINYRRPQQPRIKIFTTNYDKLIETICDLEGIQCITGFDGQNIRIFNPTNFDLNISYKTTGNSSVYYSKVLHLYKLHGSIDWQKKKIDGFDEIIQTNENILKNTLIYPCATKYSETLEMPYGEMFRRFGESASTPQTAMFTIGYGFYDEHVNQMLLRSLKNPSCQLICIEPKAEIDYEKSEISLFLKKLIRLSTPSKEVDEVSEPRICVIGGEGACFPSISELIVPETRLEDPNEEIRKTLSKLIASGSKDE